MTTADPGTVWILGAGFSRSLGAPLFRDLFRSDLQLTASIGELSPEMKRTLDRYRDHVFSTSSNPQRPAPLTIPAFFPALKVPEIKELARMARMALAIECSHFLVGDDLRAERWIPYRRWAAQLGGNDTVITFNYDLVPELLSENRNSDEGEPRLRVVVPPPRNQNNDPLGYNFRAMGAAPVFKMHGSVDWWSQNGAISTDRFRMFHNQSDAPVLGIPGPGKLDLRSKAFAEVWSAAKKAIRGAVRIVFVGYRFPPTDAQARFELLESIRNESSMAQVEIVLGPDANHPEVARMRALLGRVLVDDRIHIRPLYAEDYIDHF